MKIVFTLDLIEILINYVVSISDPLLYIIHIVERELVDENKDTCEYTLVNKIDLERFYQVIDCMLEDDVTIPSDLLLVFNKRRSL
jgi:hypothetical protein